MEILLRDAQYHDLELIMAWRSTPLIYEGFYTQNRPLTWEEHTNWWNSRNKDWRNFIIIYELRKVGSLTIGQLDHWSPEIGYLIGEVTLWGKGIGREAVKLALQYIKDYGKDYCHTTVLKNNERSLRLLGSLGFKILGDAREGEFWLTKNLS